MGSKLYILAGPDRGKSFDLPVGSPFTVGRSPDNDMTVRDPGVSRIHMKIERRMGKTYLTDLHSKNGSYLNGKKVVPGIELELYEGVLIVIGMTAFGMGEICMTCIKPLLTSMGLYDDEVLEIDESSSSRRTHTFVKNLQFVYHVCDILNTSNDIGRLSERILDEILALLGRIDRCAIILMDDKEGEVSKVVYRTRKSVADPEKVYSKELVEQSLLINKPVWVSDSYAVDNEDDAVADTLKLRRIRSAVCVPICSCFQTKGVIYIDCIDRSYSFRRSDLALLEDLSGRLALAMDKISLENYFEERSC